MAKRKFGLICLPFLIVSGFFIFFGMITAGWAKSDPTGDYDAVTHIGLKKRITTYGKGDKPDVHGNPFGDFEDAGDTALPLAIVAFVLLCLSFFFTFVRSVSGKTVKVKVVMRMFVPYKPLRRLIAGISAALACLACFATLIAWGMLAGNWLKDYPTFHYDYNFYMTGVAGGVTFIVAIVLCIAQPG
mmetsp:Transcript_3815/g.5328  ORF Transcript_3815/g.5328 Transcript_3815/m.5328 type:complete len:187 (+) Transcript_3815:241-801(+)|eukprot:CAMPEP_0168565056 /NCGR_PEP_ID=MMETSP0413-20121227/13600_1 /TAXON_ID=136452 /ORGANISM="Filamoeba nolandi, Strain NC-AS-23-1" /LENGTH=186 /DNA_ID=CAMNT_0008596819 /DNA_START=241 /DNA_END=801 /DNA_ORIENTATION=+